MIQMLYTFSFICFDAVVVVVHRNSSFKLLLSLTALSFSTVSAVHYPAGNDSSDTCEFIDKQQWTWILQLEMHTSLCYMHLRAHFAPIVCSLYYFQCCCFLLNTLQYPPTDRKLWIVHGSDFRSECRVLKHIHHGRRMICSNVPRLIKRRALGWTGLLKILEVWRNLRRMNRNKGRLLNSKTWVQLSYFPAVPGAPQVSESSYSLHTVTVLAKRSIPIAREFLQKNPIDAAAVHQDPAWGVSTLSTCGLVKAQNQFV